MDEATPTRRARARIICILCHKRKVRCDLQDSRGDTCSNCHRMNQPCIQRRGRRNKAPLLPGGIPTRFARGDSNVPSSIPKTNLATNCTGGVGKEVRVNEAPGSMSFISSESVLYDDLLSSRPGSFPWNDWRKTEELLQSFQTTTSQIDEPLRHALLDSFTENCSHWYPFIDTVQIRRDVPSVLEYTLLLAGSLGRRIQEVEDLRLPHCLYQKSKETIYANDSRDPVTLLKALTIVSCWSLRNPSVVSLDGPWHWGGFAIRLALQIGMQQESTYSRLEDPDGCRLIWWHLMNSDVLQAACWGRPCLVRFQDQDVRLPQQSDLTSTSSQIFIQITRLLAVFRRAIELNTSLPEIMTALADWHQTIPSPLKLHDTAGYRNIYSKSINEMFILYFAVIISVSFRYEMKEGHRVRVSPMTLAASSCMIRLYEEIYHREHTHQLASVHGFFLLLSAIPQVFHRTQTTDKKDLREQELDLICAVLRHLCVKFGGSNMILHRILRLRAEFQICEQQESAVDGMTHVRENITGGIIPQDDRLFPFPLRFSPNLGLLRCSISENPANPYHEDMIDLLAFESSLIDWSSDDFSGYSFGASDITV